MCVVLSMMDGFAITITTEVLVTLLSGAMLALAQCTCGVGSWVDQLMLTNQANLDVLCYLTISRWSEVSIV